MAGVEEQATEQVDPQAMERVTAVLDELVGERQRRNRAREMEARTTGKRPEELGEPGYVPTTREVESALRARYGSSFSFTKLNPCVARYIEIHDLYRVLPTRPRQRKRTGADLDGAGDALPERARRGVDKVLGGLEKIQDKLAALLAEEVAAETAGLRRENDQLSAENAELRHYAVMYEELSADVDRLREQVEALEERAARAERERDGARTAQDQAVADRDAALAAHEQLASDMEVARAEAERLHAEAGGRAAAETHRDEAVTAMERLSAALEEERRARAADAETWRRLHDEARQDRDGLTTMLRQRDDALIEAQRTISTLAARVGAVPVPTPDGDAQGEPAPDSRARRRGARTAVTPQA